jgi:hypothetical protein
MPAGRYDIQAEQGVTFRLHLFYKDTNDQPVDMSSYSGRLHVRRSPDDEQLVLVVDQNGVTGGGVTGEFVVSGNTSDFQGISGSGGIFFNYSMTGGTGLTGGILIDVDSNSMSNVPKGNHVYDFEVVAGDQTVVRLISGRFVVDREITR